MDLKDIQNHLDQVMEERNNRPMPDFEGYSPFEMHNIMHFTFAADSPLKLQKLAEADYKKIPILNQIKYLAFLIQEHGEIKLTNKGFLPTKIVSELYQQGYMKDEHIERGISRLNREKDSLTVNLTRIMLELTGISKKRNGKLSLTISGKKILKDDEELLRHILLTFAFKFNWAYYDGYGENQIGQLGFGFSLILLSKYGHKKQPDSFYSEKYFKAYPLLLESIEPEYGTLERYTSVCYSIRTFDRFMDFFGLVNISIKGKWYDRVKHISKTELFDKLISVHAHKGV